ncbi:hypothetical protein HDV00_000020 [Rhizophlyctis rosea]|nr:hypothetical protein HDV00_000020 [Rhizophlyctis rosea]
MSDYYRGATSTLTFLGGIKGPCDIVATVRTPPSSDESSGSQAAPNSTVPNFSLSKWFTRVWTLQEAVLSHNLVFYRGRDADGQHTTSTTAEILLQLCHLCYDKDVQLADHDWHRLSAVVRTLTRDAKVLRPAALFEVVSHRNCSVEEDKVYGLLGMLPMTKPPSIRYGVGSIGAVGDALFVLYPEHIAEVLLLTAWGRAKDGDVNASSFLPDLHRPLVTHDPLKKLFTGFWIPMTLLPRDEPNTPALLIPQALIWECPLKPRGGENSLLIETESHRPSSNDPTRQAWLTNTYRARTATHLEQALRAYTEEAAADTLKQQMKALNLKTTFEWNYRYCEHGDGLLGFLAPQAFVGTVDLMIALKTSQADGKGKLVDEFGVPVILGRWKGGEVGKERREVEVVGCCLFDAGPKKMGWRVLEDVTLI